MREGLKEREELPRGFLERIGGELLEAS